MPSGTRQDHPSQKRSRGHLACRQDIADSSAPMRKSPITTVQEVISPRAQFRRGRMFIRGDEGTLVLKVKTQKVPARSGGEAAGVTCKDMSGEKPPSPIETAEGLRERIAPFSGHLVESRILSRGQANVVRPPILRPNRQEHVLGREHPIERGDLSWHVVHLLDSRPEMLLCSRGGDIVLRDVLRKRTYKVR